MGAATVTERHELKMAGADVLVFQTTTAANGEDGVTLLLDWEEIWHVSVNGFATSEEGVFYGYDDSGSLTIKALAGAGGDSAAVSVMVVGIR